MVPRGLEPRTLRLLAVRSNQLSYETVDGTIDMLPLEYRNILGGITNDRLAWYPENTW